MCVNNSFEYTFYFVNSVDRDESFVDDLIEAGIVSCRVASFVTIN